MTQQRTKDQQFRLVYRHYIQPGKPGSKKSFSFSNYTTWRDAVVHLIKTAIDSAQIKLYARHGEEGQILSPSRVGAVTRCQALDHSGTVVKSGYSFCSVNDSYDRKKGNDIARGRLEKSLKHGCITDGPPKLSTSLHEEAHQGASTL